MVVIIHGFSAFRVWIGEPRILVSGLQAKEKNFLWDRMQCLFENLSFGVDIFFLISGFLITYLLLTEKEKFGTINVGKFYIRRALRIWPLYFFIILITPLLVKLM